MTIDTEDLKRKAQAAGGERWTASGSVVWFESGDGAVTGAALTHCDDSTQPPVWDDDVAAHVAACNPAAVLALIERLEAAERDAARYRWLRENGSIFSEFDQPGFSGWMVAYRDHMEKRVYSYSVADLDDAIDAAIAKGKA